MKYLLDTMVWLWSVGPSKIIGTAGLEILASAEEEIYLSAASSWEIAIKTRLGKFQLPEPPGRYVPKRLAAQGIRSLPISQDHSLPSLRPALASCRSLRPHHHRSGDSRANDCAYLGPRVREISDRCDLVREVGIAQEKSTRRKSPCSIASILSPALNPYRLLAAYRNRREPVMAIRLLSADDGVELLLNGLGDRTGNALADADLVHGTDRCNLGRRAGRRRLHPRCTAVRAECTLRLPECRGRARSARPIRA